MVLRIMNMSMNNLLLQATAACGFSTLGLAAAAINCGTEVPGLAVAAFGMWLREAHFVQVLAVLIFFHYVLFPILRVPLAS